MTAETDAHGWLARALEKALGTRVDAAENFFDAGASSLTLMRVHADLAAGPVPDAELADFFAHPTINALASHLRGRWPATAKNAANKQTPLQVSALAPVHGPERMATRIAEQSTEPHLASPKTGALELVARLSEGVLGRSISPQENFFDAGYTSLSLMRLHADLAAGAVPGLELNDLFAFPSVAELAGKCEALGYEGQEANEQVRRERVAGDYSTQTPDIVPPYDEEHAIAVVGMAIDLPGASDIESLVEMMRSGRQAIESFGPPHECEDGSTRVPARSMLDRPLDFDAGFFGIAAREARLMDPQQRVLLMVAARALADAGIAPDREEMKAIGVFASASENSYLRRIWTAEQQGISIDPLLVSLLNEKDMLSSRLSYHFNLTGPSMTVQTACSSSLTGIHLAAEQLRSGQCDAFLVGGVSIDVERRDGYVAPQGGIYSPTGACRTFAEGGDGTVPASGAGVVVLKRLRNALRDGDRIHAVLAGSAINNDGSRKVNIAAPAEGGQIEVIAAAQRDAGISSPAVGFVEAHGTGTRLGDQIEMRALQRAFGESEMPDCAIGSIKAQVGHLGAAAGIAGFIRAVLAVSRAVKPVSPHASMPIDRLGAAGNPFKLLSRSEEWSDPLRISAVSSFGVGGANAHALIVNAPTAEAQGNGSSDAGDRIPFDRRTFDILQPSGRAEEQSGDRPLDDGRDVASWFHRPVWNRFDTDEMQHVDGQKLPQVLWVGPGPQPDETGWSAFCSSVAIAPDSRSAETHLRSGGIDCVVYVVPENALEPSPESLSRAMHDCIEAPIAIAKAWKSDGGIRRLILLASDAPVAAPANALLRGPLTVLPKEQRDLRCVLATAPMHRGDRADGWMALLGFPRGEYAYRDGAWHVRGFEPLEATVATSQASGIRSGDTILVTGGTGGVGGVLAAAILQTPGTRVIILARGAGDTGSGLDERAIHVACDLSDPASVLRVVARIREQHGPIDGIVHAAGIAGSGLAATKTAEDRFAVVAPKVLGALALEKALDDAPPRFTLHCSSLSAHFASLGQIDYAAANAVLDAFALRRDGAMSVEWPSWKGTGMAKGIDAMLADNFADLQISHDEGRRIFVRALALAAPVAVVCPVALEQLEAGNATRTSEPDSMQQATASADPDVASLVAQIFAEALGNNNPQGDVSFFDQGGDSWNALIFVDEIQERLDPAFAMADLLAHDTVDKLVQFFTVPADNASRPDARETTVVMQDGDGPPVVLVHAIGGDIVAYRDLAARLAGREVIALSGFGEANDCNTLDEQAQYHLDRLPDLRGATLIGWSYGAVLGHAIALRSAAGGAPLAHFVAVDPPIPDSRHPQARPLHPEDFIETEQAFAAGRGGRAARSVAEISAIGEACMANARRLAVHVPSASLDTPSTLALASERPTTWPTRDTLVAAWTDHLSTWPETVSLPGDHYGCIRGAGADRIAQLVSSLASRDIQGIP